MCWLNLNKKKNKAEEIFPRKKKIMQIRRQKGRLNSWLVLYIWECEWEGSGMQFMLI